MRCSADWTRAIRNRKQGVFYNGQIYDAYTFVSDLIKSAKKRIILIDNYVDETVLTLLDKRGPEVTAVIYTQQISRHFQLDIDRHNAQYAPIAVDLKSATIIQYTIKGRFMSR